MQQELAVILSSDEYKWNIKYLPASDLDIRQLALYAKSNLPEDYIELLKYSNGGELSYRDIWFLKYWASDSIPHRSQSYELDQELPDTLPFGDDGADEIFLFDMRTNRDDNHYPIYMVNLYATDWKSAIFIAQDIRSFLTRKKRYFEG